MARQQLNQQTSTVMPTVSAVEMTDTEFDAYWEEEARNPHRNRIRIGRTYQATIPPKLKSGELDNRKLENLETIYWSKEYDIHDKKLDEYFMSSRTICLFNEMKHRKSKETPDEKRNGLDKDHSFVDSCHVPAGAVTTPSRRTRRDDKKRAVDDQLQAVSKFLMTCHPKEKPHGAGCRERDPPTTEHAADKWSAEETRMFCFAIDAFGKNFASIRKILPWKPAKALIQHYYKNNPPPSSDEDDGSISDSDSNESPKPPTNHLFLNNTTSSSPSATSTSPTTNNINHTSGSAGGANSANSSTSATLNPSSATNNSSNNNSSTITTTSSTTNTTTNSTTTNPTTTTTTSNGTTVNPKTNSFHQTIQVNCLTSTETHFTTHWNKAISSPAKGSQSPFNVGSPIGKGNIKMKSADPEGEEIKPLKGRAIYKNDLNGEVNGINGPQSVLGSLKFFMDGQLVLKLNAKQNDTQDKSTTKWVESMDTPRLPKKKIRKKRGEIDRSSLMSEDTSDSSESHDDEDSLGSNESRSLPSPSFILGTKVKGFTSLSDKSLTRIKLDNGLKLSKNVLSPPTSSSSSTSSTTSPPPLTSTDQGANNNTKSHKKHKVHDSRSLPLASTQNPTSQSIPLDFSYRQATTAIPNGPSNNNNLASNSHSREPKEGESPNGCLDLSIKPNNSKQQGAGGHQPPPSKP